MGLNCLTCCGGELLVGLDKHHRLSESQELELCFVSCLGSRAVVEGMCGACCLAAVWSSLVSGIQL